MGRAKPVVLSTRTFPRQLDAVEYFSSILKATAVGSRIDDEAIHGDLLALLDLHKDRTEKMGVGVAYFTAMISPEGSTCFGVKRHDGSLVDFSFHRCIKQNW